MAAEFIGPAIDQLIRISAAVQAGRGLYDIGQRIHRQARGVRGAEPYSPQYYVLVADQAVHDLRAAGLHDAADRIAAMNPEQAGRIIHNDLANRPAAVFNRPAPEQQAAGEPLTAERLEQLQRELNPSSQASSASSQPGSTDYTYTYGSGSDAGTESQPGSTDYTYTYGTGSRRPESGTGSELGSDDYTYTYGTGSNRPESLSSSQYTYGTGSEAGTGSQLGSDDYTYTYGTGSNRPESLQDALSEVGSRASRSNRSNGSVLSDIGSNGSIGSRSVLPGNSVRESLNSLQSLSRHPDYQRFPDREALMNDPNFQNLSPANQQWLLENYDQNRLDAQRRILPPDQQQRVDVISRSNALNEAQQQAVNANQGNTDGLGLFNIYNPEQQKAFSSILQKSLGSLNSNQFDFSPIEQKARQGFAQNTVPTIAERFAAMGSGPNSGAFNRAVASAGKNLETDLAAQRQGYNLQQQQLNQNLLGFGLKPQYEAFYRPGQEGASSWQDMFKKNFATTAGTGLGNLLSDPRLMYDIYKNLRGYFGGGNAPQAGNVSGVNNPNPGSVQVQAPVRAPSVQIGRRAAFDALYPASPIQHLGM